MRRFWRAAAIATAAVYGWSCGAFAEPAPPTVRVLVTERRTRIQLTVKDGWTLRALPGGALIAQGTSLSVKLTPTPNGFRFGDRTIAATGLLLEAKTARDLYLDDSRFRGHLRFYRDSGNLIYAVNHLDVEGYLYGVLHHEVGTWWPMPALEAQAIAARTYALYEARTKRAQPYDLKSGTSSQVYGGSTTERYRTKKAVDRTRGKVLAYAGKIFPAYFHATCAGRTAGANELWNIDVPPLRGSVACSYCRISPHYYWRASVPFSTIEQKLKDNGRSVGQLLSVEAISRTPSFRIGRLKFTGNAGEAIVAAKDFRVWVGGDKLKSTSFTVESRDDTALFKGKGWGHGVGLCQWGTLGQALVGRQAGTILKMYYPDAEIIDDGSIRI
jgi:stage II sporulation protein D